MFLKRVLLIGQQFARTLKLISRRLTQRAKHHNVHNGLWRGSPLFFLLASTASRCSSAPTEVDPDIQQITKQQLVFYLHQDPPQEFVVIIYDRFKRLDEKKFGDELRPIIEQCKKANVSKVYLIDSKEKQHLQQIIRLLKNMPSENVEVEQAKDTASKKPFEVYFKSKFFNEAIELERMKENPLSSQIDEIRHFSFTPNPEKLNALLTAHITHPWGSNKTLVVKQCFGEGECVQSYKREVKALIEQGMLNGKKDQYQFELVVDQPTKLLSNSSEYIKSFMREAQKLKGKSISPNRKEEIYAFRRDLLGSDVTLFSEWLEREGLNYSPSERFMMFLRPRIHLISKMNTLPDLMWYIRAARLTDRPSLSLNNTKPAHSNNASTMQVLQLLHDHFPFLNYLIVNTEKVSELIRHINADHKYVIFKQDSNIIWKKQFLDLDALETLPTHHERERLFQREFKPIIQNFIDDPQVKSLVQVEKELEINLEKLIILRTRQESKLRLRKYVIRVCKERCHRYLSPSVVEAINSKLQQPANIYWIDSTAQNIGVNDGDYILKDGTLQPLSEFLQGS